MAVAEVHPSAEELAAFTLGTLDDETQASIEAHVAACMSCQERAAVAPGDSLVELLRSVHLRTGFGTDTVSEFASQVLTPLSLLAKPDRVEVPEALPAELACHERYHIVRFLGAGGMGTVYEAEHRFLRRPVALKVIKRAYTAYAAALERFRREVHTAARLSHPNIVTTYDAEDAGETHFLVMEYIEGTDLGRLIQESGPLPVDRACDYVRQAALGLQYAFEQGMVHRDLKPQNLMLTDDGCVKILDFGLARFAGEAALAGLTTSGMVLGTVDYIAPEQADDAHEADIRSDIYSLGCTLYYLLAGRPPFPKGTPPQKLMAHVNKTPQPLTTLRGDMPEGLMSVLERMMAKNPSRRYQTPAEVAAALAPFTVPADAALSPGPRSDARATIRGRTLVLQKTPTRFRRRRIAEIATAIMVFLVTGLLGVAVYRIATDKGELVITTESDDVKVVITQGGKLVDIIDTKTNKQISLALRSGDYELELKGAPEGLKLDIDRAKLKRGETVLATITREGKPSKYYYLNLQPKATRELDSGDDRFLAALPKGEQDFAGVKFNIGAGLIQLSEERPCKVEGIKVGVTCRKLHFLHACHGPGPGADPTSGYYKVTYDDNSQETIPIVYGKDLLDWWFAEGAAGPTEARIAWIGDNAEAKRFGKKVRLYLVTWTNREPTKKVVSIDFGAVKATGQIPFCVAITAEK
jgi:Protein kinase domain/Putative zinc-finger